MVTASSPHFWKTRNTSSSRPFSATSNMRSCDSLSMISYGVMPVSRWGTRSSSISSPTPPRPSHVLDADDRAGLHGFQAGFEQQFFQEGVADQHVRTLGLRRFAELFAGHGGAVDSVPARLGADVDHRIAFPGGLGVEDLVAAHQPQRKCVDQ